jgi:hypothetical protein
VSALDEALWQLLPSLSGLSGDERDNKLLLVMQAYVDDSVEPPAFVLAGFVARAAQWGRFTIAWEKALDKPPKLDISK